MTTVAKMKLYRTAKTKVKIGEIPANTFVKVEYAYQELYTGRHVFHIRTALFGGEVADDVLESQLENFCL